MDEEDLQSQSLPITAEDKHNRWKYLAFGICLILVTLVIIAIVLRLLFEIGVIKIKVDNDGIVLPGPIITAKPSNDTQSTGNETAFQEKIVNNKMIISNRQFSIEIPKDWTYKATSYPATQTLPIKPAILELQLFSEDYVQNDEGYTTAGYEILITYGDRVWGTRPQDSILRQKKISSGTDTLTLITYKGWPETDMSNFMVIASLIGDTPFEMSTSGPLGLGNNLGMVEDEFVQIAQSIKPVKPLVFHSDFYKLSISMTGDWVGGQSHDNDTNPLLIFGIERYQGDTNRVPKLYIGAGIGANPFSTSGAVCANVGCKEVKTISTVIDGKTYLADVMHVDSEGEYRFTFDIKDKTVDVPIYDNPLPISVYALYKSETDLEQILEMLQSIKFD